MSQRYYSNIYWHFTGSPKGVNWSIARCPKDITNQGAVLDDSEAASTLNLILDSKSLWATCTEKIAEGIETEKFCCVTDIPLKDLPSHSPYYGKVAIGFKAEAIHKHFVPVLYLPEQNLPVIEKLISNRQISEMISNLLKSSDGWSEQQAMKLMPTAYKHMETTKEIDKNLIGGFYSNFVKITNFDSDPQNTYYREREWRGIGNFDFNYTDIEAVVAPSSVLPVIKNKLENLGIKDINVLSWEFIEEA